MLTYISIDIGGTAIKYGVLDSGGKILERKERATEAQRGGPAILSQVLHIVEDFLKRYDEIGGVCISTAGVVDIQKGEITHAASLIPDYAGINYKKAIWDHFHLLCEVENDVNCAGLAEGISGAAQGSQAGVMLTVGTGIGACILLNGQVFHGAGGRAGEVGYIPIGDSDFQTLASTKALTQKVAQIKQDPLSDWNGYRIFEAAKAGDSVCLQAIDEMCALLAQGIATIAYVVDPDVIVLGGGIVSQGDYLKNKLDKALELARQKGFSEPLNLRFAQYRNNAGMIGAFYHFMGRHGLSH